MASAGNTATVTSTGKPGSDHYSDSFAPSSNTTASGGFVALNGRLRSALIHPVGLPLLCFLNRGVTGEDLGSGEERDNAGGTEPVVGGAVIEPQPASSTSTRTATTRDHLERLYSKEVAALVFDSTLSEYSDVFSKTYEAWRQNSETYFTQLAQYKVDHEAWKAEDEAYRNMSKKERATTNAPSEPARPSASNEALFTYTLAENMCEKLKSIDPTIVMPDDQYSVPYDRDKPTSYSSTDFTLWRQEENENENSLLLIGEFGIACDWWKKASQNAQYVEAIRCDLGSRAGKMRRIDGAKRHAFSKPMLFAVVTIWPTKEKSFRSAALGVFLCVPATGGNDFRVALLWRSAPYALDAMSRDFGRMIRAATLLPQLLGAISDIGASHFTSLGPNCCRVRNSVRGERCLRTFLERAAASPCPGRPCISFLTLLVVKVLRAYDSRFRPTFRRPDLYYVTEINPGSGVIYRLDDSGGRVDDRSQEIQPAVAPSAAEAGPICNVTEKKRKRNRLFALEGKLEIIETPFYSGKHYARSPQDFIPVVQFLQDMHTKDYVHGDIRCFNIIFGKRLIDFDFGGKVKAGVALTYPEGYAHVLPSQDGKRRGRAGKPITKLDDVYALTQVIFDCHDFYPPDSLAVEPVSKVEESTHVTTQQEDQGTMKATDPAAYISLLESELKKKNTELKEKDSALKEKDSALKEKEMIDGLKAFPVDDSNDDPGKQLDDLLEFLERVQKAGWRVQPSKSFQMGLSECGMSFSMEGACRKDDDGPSPAGTCPAATGSPNERRREC